MSDAKQRIVEIIEAKKDEFIHAADGIWSTPETRFDDPRSVGFLYEVLDREGFSIKKGLAGMACCFEATFGSGSPTIGILAEFDALAGLSQVADADEPRPLVLHAAGHGCGHNLLGAGAVAGAVGIKEYMSESNLSGTIILFGCPAEESGYGKAFMARAGLFDKLDVALAWHPMAATSAWGMSSLAVYQVYYNFKGIAAHAAAAPEQGRSALDAAELMNVGVQFLREHIIERARIHYAFMDAGGTSANVVQPTASLFYFVRSPKVEQAADIHRRVSDIARGAALMTGTKVEEVFSSACHEYRPNRALTEIMYQNLKRFGALGLTAADQRYAKRYRDTLSDEAKRELIEHARCNDSDISEEEARRLGSLPISEQIEPLVFSDETSGSTDVGDVSWVCPTAQVTLACEPQGTSPHTWQWVANGTSDIAHKGLLAAGRVIATTACDALVDADLVERARREHEKMLDGRAYRSAIPADVRPR